MVVTVSEENFPFTTLLVTYDGDKPLHLFGALKSLSDQSLKADETVLVCAGPLPDHHNSIIADFVEKLRIKRIDLFANRQLGFSLNIGLKAASHDWVARMDADDIAHPERFRRQFEYLRRHPRTDVLGTAIEEFTDNPAQPYTIRSVPIDHNVIARTAFMRSPFNHMTVVYKKSVVLSVGGYRMIRGFEDFDLWTRMLANGARMANLPEPLLSARITAGHYKRRGGLAYANAECYALSKANRLNKTNPWRIRLSLGPRYIIRLLPDIVRQKIYLLHRKYTSKIDRAN